jgi:phosphoglycerate dehydrogenase-like enzyme
VKLVVFPKMDAAWERRVAEAAPTLTIVQCGSEAQAAAALADAEAFYGKITPALLAGAKRLRWIQAPVAGLERYMFPELAAHPAVLTNMRGVYGDMVPEHAFALVLVLARGMHRYAWLQRERMWLKQEIVILAGKTMGVVGLGSIGGGVADRAVAFGMRVIAVDPKAERHPGVERVLRPDRLHELLAESDVVVIAAPHTPETEKMFRRRELQAMKRSAFLVNVGRGVIVDLRDLTDALAAGDIAGAGLDVFELEPLPTDHPLWGMDNVVITPHAATETPELSDRWLGVLADNAARFARGEPLQNVVDKQRWY